MRRSFDLAMVVAIGLVMAACGGGTASPGGSLITTSPSASATAAGESELRVVSGVLYQEDPDGTQHTLDIYAPATEGGPWPVAVMIHGAGGCCLPDEWVSAVARQDAVVFVPSWPDNAPWPSTKALLADVTAITGQLACAVRFARAEAERYGGDPSNLSLFGHSAGANYASMIAFADPEVAQGCVASSGSVVPDNLVLFDGQWLIIDPSGIWDEYLREDSRAVLDAHTPWSYLEEATGMPSTSWAQVTPPAVGPRGMWIAGCP